MPPRRKEPTKSPKGKQATKPVPQSLPNGKRAALEEELDSGASSGDEDALGEEEEPEEPSETADERRVRLAKDLLAGMDAAVESSTRESRIRDGDDAVADQLEEEARCRKWKSRWLRLRPAGSPEATISASSCLRLPGAPASLGQSAACAALAGHTGRVFDAGVASERQVALAASSLACRLRDRARRRARPAGAAAERDVRGARARRERELLRRQGRQPLAVGPCDGGAQSAEDSDQ